MAVPIVPPPQPSARARELGGRIAQTVREYRAGHELTATEVDQAFRLAREEVAGGLAGRRAMAALLAGVLALGLGVLVAAQRGLSWSSVSLILVAVLAMAVVALVAAARRS